MLLFKKFKKPAGADVSMEYAREIILGLGEQAAEQNNQGVNPATVLKPAEVKAPSANTEVTNNGVVSATATQLPRASMR